MKNKLKCQGCKSRYLGCHAECADYKTYREERDEYLDFLCEKRNEFNDIMLNSNSGYQRMRRRIKRSKIK